MSDKERGYLLPEIPSTPPLDANVARTVRDLLARHNAADLTECILGADTLTRLETTT